MSTRNEGECVTAVVDFKLLALDQEPTNVRPHLCMMVFEREVTAVCVAWDTRLPELNRTKRNLQTALPTWAS